MGLDGPSSQPSTAPPSCWTASSAALDGLTVQVTAYPALDGVSVWTDFVKFLGRPVRPLDGGGGGVIHPCLDGLGVFWTAWACLDGFPAS